VSGIPELAVDRDSAMVVPAGNAKQLAYALASVLSDQNLRETLVVNALRRVRAQHDLHDNVAMLASLFVPPELVP
jgi:glycosyltransferase involved in cell wall biosynthesis